MRYHQTSDLDLFQWTMLDAKGEMNLRIYSNSCLSTTSNVWPFDRGLCRGLWWCGSGRTSVPWGFGLELFATPSKTWYFGISYWKLRDSIPTMCGIVQVLRYLLEYYGRSDFFCVFFIWKWVLLKKVPLHQVEMSLPVTASYSESPNHLGSAKP